MIDHYDGVRVIMKNGDGGPEQGDYACVRVDIAGPSTFRVDDGWKLIGFGCVAGAPSHVDLVYRFVGAGGAP